jgi:hypothetical protein
VNNSKTFWEAEGIKEAKQVEVGTSHHDSSESQSTTSSLQKLDGHKSYRRRAPYAALQQDHSSRQEQKEHNVRAEPAIHGKDDLLCASSERKRYFIMLRGNRYVSSGAAS